MSGDEIAHAALRWRGGSLQDSHRVKSRCSCRSASIPCGLMWEREDEPPKARTPGDRAGARVGCACGRLESSEPRRPGEVHSFLGACGEAVATALAGGGLVADPRSCDADLGTCTTSLEICNTSSRLPKSGQTTSYGPGSDGAVQAGRALSYTDNGDGTITDNVTGLMWEKKDDSGGIHDKDNDYTWSGASYGAGTYLPDGTMFSTCDAERWQRLRGVHRLARPAGDCISSGGHLDLPACEGAFGETTSICLVVDRGRDGGAYCLAIRCPRQLQSDSRDRRGLSRRRR